MNANKFFDGLMKGIKDVVHNPMIILPSLALWLALYLLSKLSVSVNYKIASASVTIITSWFVIFSLITLGVMSYFFSGIIGMSLKNVRSKSGLNDFFKNSRKYWFRNYIITIIIALSAMLVSRVAHYGAFGLGRLLDLDVGAARLAFILIYFFGLVGFLMFLTFSSFLLILKNYSIKKSISSSVNLVRREYLAVLSLSVILFIFFSLMGLIEGLVGEIIEYVIVIPFAASIYARFVSQTGSKR